MPADFFDTNAVVKHYHREAASAVIEQLWMEPARRLHISRLTALEIVSVFCAKSRARAISRAQSENLQGRFSADVATTRRLILHPLRPAHYKTAEDLLRQHGPLRSLRTLDALQLAVAVHLWRNGAIDRLVSSDKELLAVAALEGLPVFDPENP